VALFDASDDTTDMLQKLLTDSGKNQTLISGHFADLKKGIVIFDFSPPYDENWKYFKTMGDDKAMKGVRNCTLDY